MFKITIAEIESFKKQVKLIKELATEIDFVINDQGLSFRTYDTANVCVIDFQYFTSAFTVFEHDQDDKFGISVDKLNKILKIAPKDSMLELSKKSSKLIIKIIGSTVRKYMIPIMDPSDKVFEMPHLTYDVKLSLDSGLFKEEITAISIIADSVVFKSNPEELELIGEGDSGDSVKTKFKETSYDLDGYAESKYSIEYLQIISESSGFADDVKLQFSQETPISLIYEKREKFKVEFILAPRVDNE